LFLLVGLLAGSVEEETVGGSTEWAGYNLPAWITDEMMEAFTGRKKNMECQYPPVISGDRGKHRKLRRRNVWVGLLS
ncbi:hypothetical protein, partial [Suipraeoptans intestinalis]|uniref:hypothetical protein n=1 Tax=Suipraeoptans intestinalis TaxID=2606628 RepID=UPI0019D5A70E